MTKHLFSKKPIQTKIIPMKKIMLQIGKETATTEMKKEEIHLIQGDNTNKYNRYGPRNQSNG